jgi:hypothetical protein
MPCTLRIDLLVWEFDMKPPVPPPLPTPLPPLSTCSPRPLFKSTDLQDMLICRASSDIAISTIRAPEEKKDRRDASLCIEVRVSRCLPKRAACLAEPRKLESIFWKRQMQHSDVLLLEVPARAHKPASRFPPQGQEHCNTFFLNTHVTARKPGHPTFYEEYAPRDGERRAIRLCMGRRS